MALCLFAVFLPGISSGRSAEVRRFMPGDTLEEIREKIKINGYNFKVDHSRIYDMSPEMRKQFLNRHKSVRPKDATGTLHDAGPLSSRMEGGPLPEKFDWRDYDGHSYIGPVRDQGSCGACYAFSACAAAEGTYNKVTGRYDDDCVDFSESFIAWCLGGLEKYVDHFYGCAGADYDYYELTALTDEGIVREGSFPYVEYDPGSCEHWDDPRTVFSGWYRIPCGDTEAIKIAIREYGVVDAAVLTTDAFLAYSEGIYEDANITCPEGYYAETDHAIALVGWDDTPPEGGGGCWILRNSWGEGWGEDGYMRISYNAAHVACAGTYLVYDPVPVVVTQSATGIITGGATLNGEVGSEGVSTDYYFEYGTTTDYEFETEHRDAGSEPALVTVSEDLTGLDPEKTYHFRIAADNTFGGSAYGSDKSFTTLGIPDIPVVATTAAQDISCTTVTLNGTVNPKSDGTTCHFEYGTTMDYGRKTISRYLEAGIYDVPVTFSVSGLDPGTSYHFRLAAENSIGGPIYGDDRTFETPSIILQEGFESDGAIPTGWTIEYVTGSTEWSFRDGGEEGHPPSANSGEYNACFYSTSGNSTKLVSPPMEFVEGARDAKLIFWHCMEGWLGDQDELRVYYRTSSGGSWILLREYTNSVGSWTRRAISLPNPGSAYYVAFEGAGYFGYGVCVDDIEISAVFPAKSSSKGGGGGGCFIDAAAYNFQ